MPAKQTKDGQYRDIVYPLNKETRQNLEKIVLEEYNRVAHRPMPTLERISNLL